MHLALLASLLGDPVVAGSVGRRQLRAQRLEQRDRQAERQRRQWLRRGL
jgi:hypothetical protein